MLVLLSHVVAFSALFVGSIFDLKTTEVPDSISVTGVLGGILLHFLASLNSGMQLKVLADPGILFSQPLTWLSALGDPLLWSLGVGTVFSIYGWGLYYIGMWGGADAFAMSILGFGAPYGLGGPGVLHSIDLFLNIMIAGFAYTLLFAASRSFNEPEVWKKTWNELKQNESRISLEVLAAGFVGFTGEFTGIYNGLFYFVFLTAIVFLYRFLNVLQDELMSEEVDVDDLEGGEVLDSAEEKGGRIEGITEEDIESIDSDKVEIRDGVKFIPVFPIALLLTDTVGLGIEFIRLMVS